MKVFNNKLLSGAFVLSIGGLITKILGAFYRIPLTNILGAEGIGVYQAVFPLYCLLLTASSTGVPNGIAKIIAENNAKNDISLSYSVLKSALKLFVPIGMIGSAFMLVFCKILSKVQGNISAALSYALISPSVFAVSVISCFRGFFQGYTDMKPTAVSQITEQTVKLVFGLTLCSIINGTVEIKAGMAALAVTVSELITCGYFFVVFKRKGFAFKNLKGVASNVKTLVKNVLPIMLSTLVIPTARTVESFFILNILSGYTSDATALYGLYSGAAESLVSVPVSVCYAVATTSVPIISAVRDNVAAARKKSYQAMLYTFIGGVGFALCFLCFSGLAVKILYGNLSAAHTEITVDLLRISAMSVLLLPLMQTTASVLIALGKTYVPPVTSGIAVTVKLVSSFILLYNPKVNIFGAVISDILCYFVAFTLNLMYIILILKKRRKVCIKLPQSV